MITPETETWLRSSQLAERWKVNPKTIARYATHQGLPFEETPGGHRRYRLDLAEQWRKDRQPHREMMRAKAAVRWMKSQQSGNGQRP